MTAATGNTRFPILQLYKPADVVRTRQSEQRVRYDNPFGFSAWQVLRRDAVYMYARDMAATAGVDARAELVVETLLRWKVSEQPQQQHIMLDYKTLVPPIGGASSSVDNAAIGDGLLLLVACQIIPSNEAYATYRELFTSQPAAAAIGTLVPEAASGPRPTSIPPSETDDTAQLAALTDRYGNAGVLFYNTYHNAYPVTVSAIAASDTPPPAVSAASVLSDDDEPEGATNEMDVDSSAPRLIAPLPPVASSAKASNEKLLRWYHDVLRSQKSRIRIVLRGYVSRAVVRSAARLEFEPDNCMYVLDGRFVCSNPNHALEAVPPPSDDDESSDSNSEPSAHSTDYASEPSVVHAESTDDDLARQNINSYQPAALEPPAPQPQSPSSIVDSDTPHILDRLYDLTLTDLTYYELDKALRHRFNLHSALYSYWHAQQTLDASYVRKYPGGYDAPARQRFKQAPGLLTTASYTDYAAIGLAGLCVLAAMSQPLREWLLVAEAYYYRAAIHDGDPTEYVARIDQFIGRCIAPTEGDLHLLMINALEDANRKIAEIEKQAADGATLADDDETAAEDDVVSQEEVIEETDSSATSHLE